MPGAAEGPRAPKGAPGSAGFYRAPKTMGFGVGWGGISLNRSIFWTRSTAGLQAWRAALEPGPGSEARNRRILFVNRRCQIPVAGFRGSGTTWNEFCTILPGLGADCWAQDRRQAGSWTEASGALPPGLEAGAAVPSAGPLRTKLRTDCSGPSCRASGCDESSSGPLDLDEYAKPNHPSRQPTLAECAPQGVPARQRSGARASGRGWRPAHSRSAPCAAPKCPFSHHHAILSESPSKVQN